MGLLQMLLQVTNYSGYFGQDEEISDIPLNFWYTLQDTLLDTVHLPTLIAPSSTAFKSGTGAAGIVAGMSMDSSISGIASVSSSIETIPNEVIKDESAGQNFMGSNDGNREALSQIHTLFERVFMELLTVLCRKSVFPADAEWNRWSVGMFRTAQFI
jgi:hypothetical protein